ncbi:MAG: hypothetical protein A3H69_00395 [Candidatus Sungbacteria bacterium RIFCSPLOWO2_02_FULL_47_9]|uniref:Queuine tRNA-ribosyltransferase n=1 Tax=Candidatus Sungbacteria bacterium RIFCSPHIGHO2_01_FULL_47_32 TaxID=1802264 RepID=A0A1G2K5P2_9BACT|nr:MAG: hypothetical protein UX72_C0021G0012 [Parcubacteria group bacterium GW2011_GWA2_47_10]OGZ93748.1 MAG: hypothetical protein A2633_02670 [Candidatus Sungbacteria bacterium RIFCSPHIGHO2_01_FULL_47_32]OHA00023.1 MAG: hypothetical protein A3D57_03800 [Candidatus Sungbacteria bacterium RIFCSPHIGHO2_02_FULL_46_12]OHA05121.1 MAG: hypothetical protein A3A28_00665 [Candidatus Sungbacteria bacterium RIFCSPLOWO2_01_FULL_47_32]OHA09793.1 MAG: hypothetical protein A3H69_00395 [Candidatus Sungbacteria
MDKFSFSITQTSKKSRARTGTLRTPHGSVETPSFVAVGTHASVKALGPDDVHMADSSIVLANTYHLFLSKTHAVIKKTGGLSRFMRWDGPTMTDSGGFQVFSLGFAKDHDIGRNSSIFPGENLKKISKAKDIKESQHVKILDEGAVFRLPDGTRTVLTPEKSISIQEDIGADIMFAFDECTSPLATWEYSKEAMERTHQWATRSLEAKKRGDQALYGIVQGGEWDDLREESAQKISSLPFDGFGIGGSLGKTKKRMFELIGFVHERLPEQKPRHVLGVGYPEDIPELIRLGADTFDCVAPTREARNGTLYIKEGRLSVEKAENREDFSPIDSSCVCFTCQNFTRAYLHHLFRSRELLYFRLASIHNLSYINAITRDIREKIKQGRF